MGNVMKRWGFLCVLAFICSPALARSGTAIQQMEVTTTFAAQAMDISQPTTEDALKWASDDERDLDRHLAAALKESRSHRDLRAAVKAYYIAAKTYFDSVGGNGFADVENMKRLLADVQSKGNALLLEEKLAGMEHSK